jgi:hypothetical protein
MNKKQSFPQMGTEKKSNGAKPFPSKNTEMKVLISKKLSLKHEFPVTSKGKGLNLLKVQRRSD